MLVHKKGCLQYCVTDCNIIVEVRTILNAHSHKEALCAPHCSGWYLFPAVLRHHTDSSAVYFTVTVLSVYKYCLSGSRNIRLCNGKECFHRFSTFVSESIKTAARLPTVCTDRMCSTLHNAECLQCWKEMHLSRLSNTSVSKLPWQVWLSQASCHTRSVTYLMWLLLLVWGSLCCGKDRTHNQVLQLQHKGSFLRLFFR